MHHVGFSRFLNSGRPTILGQPLELKALAKDGREFAARHVIIAEKVAGQWVSRPQSNGLINPERRL